MSRLYGRGAPSCLVRGCLTTLKDTAAGCEGFESLHGDTVSLSSGVVAFMDGNSSVNDWLNRFMNMMVNMLALDSGCSGCCMSGFTGMGGVLELGSLTLESLASLVVIAVMELLVDHILHLVMVLFRENLLVLNWLDSGVVVVLVDLTINSLGELLVARRFNVLVGGSWSNALGNVGSVASFASEACDCGLCFVHFDLNVNSRCCGKGEVYFPWIFE